MNIIRKLNAVHVTLVLIVLCMRFKHMINKKHTYAITSQELCVHTVPTHKATREYAIDYKNTIRTRKN